MITTDDMNAIADSLAHAATLVDAGRRFGRKVLIIDAWRAMEADTFLATGLNLEAVKAMIPAMNRSDYNSLQATRCDLQAVLIERGQGADLAASSVKAGNSNFHFINADLD